MGTCLDTDHKNGSQVFEDGDVESIGKWRGEAGLLSTPPDGHFPMQNVGPVKFEPPNIPVIFVLGGPGSGKVTHCDNLVQEKKGITHINMTDLLQQYALGNDMQDFGLLSSKTVAEVLMLEMKMSPSAKTFLVSGYPRNMRDVVEYSEKIQIVNGVLLVSWRQEVLERQIDYGAQLGHVILSLARMELRNFYRNVMPVAEYFDRSGILLEVNGERNPSEVYVDFCEAAMRLLGLSDVTALNRRAPHSMETEVEVERTDAVGVSKSINNVPLVPPMARVNLAKTANKHRKSVPNFIWVIGGPGSNKAQLCVQAMRNMPNWIHISIGNLLRTMTSSNIFVRDAIVAGEMVSQDIIMQLVEQQVILNRDNDGIIIDGFPRDINQVEEFESKFGQEAPLVLLDCSKLQLGRGKLDDSVPAFRKRLEIFREITLPMLKTLDNDSRLITVDGDTDVPSVQQEFATIMYQLMLKSRIPNGMTQNIIESGIKSHHKPHHHHNNNNNNNNHNNNNNNHNNNNNNNNNSSNNNGETVDNGRIRVNKKMMNGGTNSYGAETEVMNFNVGDVVNGGTRIANGVVQYSRANDNHIQVNGVAIGTQHRLQNGVGHITNGISPGLNRVAPAPIVATDNIAINPKESIRGMHNETGGYHKDLHM